jgi:hypothetical protein
MKVKIIFILLYTTSIAIAGSSYMFELPSNLKYNLLPDFVLQKKQMPPRNTNVYKEKKLNVKLNGIFKINGEYVALIDGESYKKGDKYKSHKIVKITMNSVEIIKNGKKVILYVEE